MQYCRMTGVQSEELPTHSLGESSARALSGLCLGSPAWNTPVTALTNMTMIISTISADKSILRAKAVIHVKYGTRHF